MNSGNQAPLYVYFVYGIVPEFMPHIAFRRDKHFKTADKKIVKCPHCKNTFTTVNKTERIELYRYTGKKKDAFHRSLPCMSCDTEVGVIYAVA